MFRLRLIKAGSLAVVLILLLASVALAIAPPTAKQVYPPVNFYRNLLITGDTLVVGKYNISYTAVPTESATDAYLISLLDSTGNVTAVTQPVNFYNKGYSDGAFSLYIPSGVTWGGTYTIRLQGNPALTWTGVVPLVDMTNFTWNTSITGLAIYTLTLASQLETSWGAVTWDLVTSGSTGNKLTTLGEGYFTQVIANLKTLAPSIFSISEQNPQFVRRVYTKAFETELLNVWNLTAYAGYFTTLNNYVEATYPNIIKLIIALILLFMVAIITLQVGADGWEIPALIAPMWYFLTVVGFIPLALLMIYTLAFILLGVFVFLYKRSSV